MMLVHRCKGKKNVTKEIVQIRVIFAPKKKQKKAKKKKHSIKYSILKSSKKNKKIYMLTYTYLP
jgi:hypothetical protein